MAFEDFIIPGASIASGLLNLISGDTERSRKKKALDRYRKALQDTKYSSVDKRAALDTTSDIFNTQSNQALNESTAGLATKGFLNTGTRNAIIQSKLIGQKSSAIGQQSNQIDMFNKDVDTKIAQSELDIPQGNAVDDILTGGLSGAELGMSLKSLINESDITSQMLEELKKKQSSKSPYLGGFLKFKRPFPGGVNGNNPSNQ